MNRKGGSVCLVMVLLLGSIVILDVTMDITPRVEAITIYVDDDGGADYTTIQEGVDAAGDGDTVYVYSGVYYEHVEILDKSITLTGENRDTTIIDGSVSGNVIMINNAYSTTIQKFTIRKANTGIYINFNGEGCNLNNNRIQDMSVFGICDYFGNCFISINIIDNCTTAIASMFNTIKNNVINNCEIGIYLADMHNFIYNNNINVDGLGLYFSEPYCARSVISQNNTVNGEIVYHFFDVHGTPGSPITLQNLPLGNSNISNLGRITFTDCSHIKITKNNINNNSQGSGIFVYSSDNITIFGNLIEKNLGLRPGPSIYDSGIQILGSKCIDIFNNLIFNNVKGIYCREGYDKAFNAENINDITIENNNISKNGKGIYINSGSYITIIKNNITNNNDNGIHFEERAYYGQIKTNFISNNTIGIFFDSWSSSNNARYMDVINNTLKGNPVGMHLSYAWNNTIMDNKILSCGSVGVKSRYYSRYNVYSNNTIESDGNSFEFDRDTDNTYVNNTINGGAYDIYFSGSSASHVALLNCSFNKSKVYYSNQGSTLTVQWYLDVNVTNLLGQLLPDTPVCIKDTKDSLPPQRYKTDSQGYVRWLVETEYLEQDINGDTIGEKDYYTPHTIMAWNETNTGFTETIMSQSKEENVILDDLPSFNITLTKGWNLISLPLVQSDTFITTVLSSITGNYDKVMWFNTSEGKWHTTDDDLTDLDHTMGFWIHMKTADTLIVNGAIPNTTYIQLYQGWNLVGNPSFCIHGIDDILSPIATKYVAVQQYDSWDSSDPWKHYHINKPQNLNDLAYMTSGRGYWLYVKEDCVWEVSNF